PGADWPSTATSNANRPAIIVDNSNRDMANLRKCVEIPTRFRYTQLPTAGTAMLSSRRQFLSHATSLGSAALAWLYAQDATRADRISGTHHEPKVKRVIQVFCPGGVSHVDTFDYKPELEKQDGKAMMGKGMADTFFGQPGNLMKSPFAFKQHGKCGR